MINSINNAKIPEDYEDDFEDVELTNLQLDVTLAPKTNLFGKREVGIFN